ncbi:MAG: hypothetical protein B6242_17020 [Anaerolineaceae bacterium 4572_78]|nr:MAG: hypothetical protein B6242_17020 [Anaerolineaceae bacterium 4572_78]
MLMLLGMLLVLPSNRHVGLAEEPDDGEEIETVTFYLPFGPDTVSSGYSGIYASRTGRLYKSAYQSDGLTFSNSYYHGSNDYTTASQRGAIDFVVSQETPIRSVADGTVTKGVLGRSHAACIIKIRHTDGSITGYWHLNQSYVQTGDTVVKGEVIGLSGEQEGDKDGTNCGTAFGAHLHFVRNIGNETTISFADSSLNNHTGRYVRPSKTYFYKADGTIPHDNQYSPSDEFPYGLNPDPDIDPGFPYMIAFVAAGAIDLDNGYYLPNDNVTRAVMAQALVVSLQQERTYDDGVEPFPDVPTNHEDYHFIRRLKELSITGGFSDGTYRPDNEVTRCQMAVMITNARQEAPPPEHTGPPSFPDVPSDHSCLDYIEHIVNLGIAGGYSDGNFHPENSVTRRQIAYMLYKAFPLYFIMNLSSDGSQRTMAAVDTNDHGLPAVEGYHPRFYDVLPDHPFYRYVEAIAKRSITGGCSSIDPTIYCPEDYLTRGQASAFIARSMGREPTYNDGRQTFPDVPSSHAFYDAIEYLAELGGIIGGYSDGNFRPDGDVTKRQLAVMVVNTLKNHLGVTCPTEHTSEFPDAPPSEEAYDWIQCAKDLGITNGDSNGYYNPNDSITRGAAAKFMYIAFIQIIVDIPQEESDSINNNASTAPILPDHNSEIGEHGGYTADMVIPHDDTDWICKHCFG